MFKDNYAASSAARNVIEFSDFHLRNSKVTLDSLAQMYQQRVPISSLVLYDEQGALLAAEHRIDVAVVSFSHGTPKGHPTEDTATLEDLLKAVRNVRNTNPYSFIVGDLPVSCYPLNQKSREAAIALIKAGADAIKIEGSYEIAPLVEELTLMSIKVIGHIGYTPKTKMTMRVRGKTDSDFEQLERDAFAIKQAGAVALVLELIHRDAASAITSNVNIPTFGVYSGPYTSGQVLVLNDLLDITEYDPKFFPKGKPKSIGKWSGSPDVRVHNFCRSVKLRKFPEYH